MLLWEYNIPNITRENFVSLRENLSLHTDSKKFQHVCKPERVGIFRNNRVDGLSSDHYTLPKF